ncbi:hypothetical protein TTHERM_000047299 (macronuclear) [Tetrahymena thermophila SB210]|uniref:Uncharacterized protein n=1 Tax=Tetrahymena thermophila (strain SB210) TaxID=312017 RepID=W7XBB6_TETTS|nr:hypothetical protein TTHERM_000047299 [Tetrahymena thermophila SB210]EWS74617.1 hypothetical protein TTHERM_000047299 [Tetrahymena thermophila SB210]|eukprot:XP_012652839.1 hypothetical protein TTHERM_000047299 [Tetrahymena thermophila SB210]
MCILRPQAQGDIRFLLQNSSYLITLNIKIQMVGRFNFQMIDKQEIRIIKQTV